MTNPNKISSTYMVCLTVGPIQLFISLYSIGEHLEETMLLFRMGTIKKVSHLKLQHRPTYQPAFINCKILNGQSLRSNQAKRNFTHDTNVLFDLFVIWRDPDEFYTNWRYTLKYSLLRVHILCFFFVVASNQIILRILEAQATTLPTYYAT